MVASRRSRGGECSVIPPKTKDVCLFFLTYHHAHPNPGNEEDANEDANENDDDDEDQPSQSKIIKEKRNRRIAAKTILKGYDAGEFPPLWILEEKNEKDKRRPQDCYEGS